MKEILGKPAKPVQFHTLVLRVPRLSTYSCVITNCVRDALEEYLLSYSEPENTTDDRWYYSNLKELLYSDEGEVNISAFETWEEYRVFLRDPIGAFHTYYELIGQLFEEIVEDNQDRIEILYDAVNIQAVDVVLDRSIITLCIRGTST